MKKARKGFTLVELLIVVAILGVLAAVMTVSSGSSIAKAKATSIANNLAICKTAAQIYYLEHGDEAGNDGIDSKTASDVLTARVPNWGDFSDGLVKYEAGSEAGPKNWTVKVTVTGNDADEILKALGNVKGFGFSGTLTSPVTVNLFDNATTTTNDDNNDDDDDGTGD